MVLESPAQPAPSLRELLADFGPVQAVNGFIGFVFAITGPVAVILSVGGASGLSQALLASTLFGAFFVNGLLGIGFSLTYRQPLVFFWTIPGVVLVGQALTHLQFAEVVGAFLAAGVLMLALGLSGWVRRVMSALPMPIVMGMVAGVFLKFGTNIVWSVRDEFGVSAPMVIVFVALSAMPRLGRWVPPLVGSMIAGILAIGLLDRFHPVQAPDANIWVEPLLTLPRFSWQAMLELVLPLTITVLAAQNGQGFAVLSAAGHAPPINAVTTACGAWSLLTAWLGTASTCLTGPTNAIVASSGPRERHYAGAVFVGVLAMIFGLLSPVFIRWMLGSPPAFIAVLAGLAMLRALQAAFVTAFREQAALGALVAFLVTVADVPIARIGAPFWALVFGWIAARLMEPARKAPPPNPGGPGAS
jgi:benzoate membrane transport protein